MTAHCRSCNRPIIWAQTSTGKAMPVDPDPVPGGNITLSKIPRTSDGLRMLATVETADATIARHKSHFASCAYARQHRKKGAATL